MSDVRIPPPDVEPGDPRLAELERTWADPPGLLGWFATVDHKRIAIRYLCTAFFFFLLAGLTAVVMRVQLSRPDNHLLGPDRYNELFSLHGSSMMFLFAVPVMEAVALYLTPLMCGARNMAFPRLNAFSYFVYVGGCLTLWGGFVLNAGPDLGWFEYVPLSGPEYSPGKRADVWAQMITFTEVAALAVSVNVTATILKMRAPGMTLARMPLFLWAVLVASLMTIFALPAVMVVTSLLISDRLIATQFYNYVEGGDAVLFQHLFWFFGHPEVYIIFIPALGFVSPVVEAFARRPVFGYTAMVLALVAIGFLAFGLWVHHMFATGLPRMGNSFYTAASMAIALPTGVQIFCWIATLWSGKPVFKTPLLWMIGFIVTFVIGGLTGVMVASAPLDLQLHDTYFVVAHFHYVLVGGAVFPLFGAFYFWFPKIAGKMLSETLGKWHFWLTVVGFNVGFFPMHILGLLGMPRRVYTYPAELGWGGYNLVATAGGLIMGAGIACMVANLFISLRKGEPAPDNPWDAPSLEWAASSPPRPYNFPHTPAVSSHAPLWTDRDALPVLSGLPSDRREVLVTSVLEAEPDNRQESPKPSLWPLVSAIAVSILLIGSMFSEWALVWGALPVGIAFTGWFWPQRKRRGQLEELPA